MSLFRRCARTLAWAGPLALFALASPLSAQTVASFRPDDPRIAYSDYACGHFSPQRVGFDRQLAVEWVCYMEQMSPGVRASFTVDASHIRFGLDYYFAGFSCGAEAPPPLSWEFGLVVDGVRRPTGARNPLYPMLDGATSWIYLGPGEFHQVTLIWPSGADVDLLGVQLKETRDGTAPDLLTPVPREQSVLTVFGESITQGLDASHVVNTYPVRLGAMMDWRVINLGFAGRTTVPSDAWLAAGNPACASAQGVAPDLLLLAIGSNDFHSFQNAYTRLDRFEQRYRDWIAQFRALRPSTPILCLTPLPRGDECTITTRTMEEYRERIRAVVAARADPSIYLFEGRDLFALPPAPGDPLFDTWLLHPTDLGFAQMAERLGRFNLIRNGGFELRPLAACQEIAEPEPYLWTDLATGASAVTNGPGSRALRLSSAAVRTQEIHGLSAGDRFSLVGSGLTTVSGSPGRITLQFLDASGAEVAAPLVLNFAHSTLRRVTRQGTVPAGAIRGRISLSKSAGPGQFLVDDLELTVTEF